MDLGKSIFLIGGFNARIGYLPDYISNDDKYLYIDNSNMVAFLNDTSMLQN